MAAAELPALLYLGDVQVESSYHSSLQLFRLLQRYPPARLRVVETRLPASAPAQRLSGVDYASLPLAVPSLLARRPAARAVWLAASVGRYDRRAQSLAHGFRPEAVLTVGHGFGWLLGDRVATALGVPLHLIAHDDWPKLPPGSRFIKSWLRRRFGAVYRRAASRLCVSPWMAQIYERRYGAPATVLYPIRADGGEVSELVKPRALPDRRGMVVGYAGSAGREVMSGLRDLARALTLAHGRALMFGPFDGATQQELLSLCPAIEFAGPAPVPDRDMMAALRARTDVLFVPMSFDPTDTDYAVLSFPSKLADYTATGVPVLVHGPERCSAAQWAVAHGGAAEVVSVAGPAALAAALARLSADSDHRRALAARALAAGRMFDPARGREILDAALTGSARVD